MALPIRLFSGSNYPAQSSLERLSQALGTVLPQIWLYFLTLSHGVDAHSSQKYLYETRSIIKN